MNKYIKAIHQAKLDLGESLSREDKKELIDIKKHFDLEWEDGGYDVQEVSGGTAEKPKLSLRSASKLGGYYFESYSLKPLPRALPLTLDEACDLIDERDKEIYTTSKPIEISEGEFWDALEVLPPQRWKGGVFYCMEGLTGSIHAMYCEIGGRYFVANRCIVDTSNSDFKQECAAML